MILNLASSITQPNSGYGSLCEVCERRAENPYDRDGIACDAAVLGDLRRYTEGGVDPSVYDQLFADFIEVCSSFSGTEDSRVARDEMQHLIRFITSSPLADDSDTIPILAEWLSEAHPDLVKVHRSGRALLTSPNQIMMIEDRGRESVVVRYNGLSFDIDLHDPESISKIDKLIKNWVK